MDVHEFEIIKHFLGMKYEDYVNLAENDKIDMPTVFKELVETSRYHEQCEWRLEGKDTTDASDPKQIICTREQKLYCSLEEEPLGNWTTTVCGSRDEDGKWEQHIVECLYEDNGALMGLLSALRHLAEYYGFSDEDPYVNNPEDGPIDKESEFKWTDYWPKRKEKKNE